jgi:two-component system response regulator YesN
MNMPVLNVIVVDDELPLRQELRSFPWESWGAALVGEAENGLEALRLCYDCEPDVVVTDITMPLMNGLELFEQLKRQFPHIQVIMLTCHSEFNYAREAVRLGALEYMLKVTLDENDMGAALQKARDIIDREKALRKEESASRRKNQSRVIGRLLKEKGMEDKAVTEQLSAAGLLGNLPSRLVLLRVKGSQEDSVFVHQEVEAALERLESSSLSVFSWVPVCPSEYMLIFGEPQNLHQLRAKVEAIIKDIGRTLDESLPFIGREVRIYAIISEAVESGTAILGQFHQAKLWDQAKFYEPETEQFVFVGRSVPLVPMSKELWSELTEPIRKYRLQPEALIDYLRGDFQKMILKIRIIPDELRKKAAQLLAEWENEPGIAGQAEMPLQAVVQAETLQQLIAFMLLAADIRFGSGSRSRKEVRDAKAYIEAHLAEPLTLLIVADHVGLSPHYLSRLFREETGESINEYMTRLRIDKAIVLLQSTSMKVYEVAEQVGIPSYRYFSTMFRSRTGIPPTDYKKLAGARGGE